VLSNDINPAGSNLFITKQRVAPVNSKATTRIFEHYKLYLWVEKNTFDNFKEVQCIIGTGFVFISPNFKPSHLLHFNTDCRNLASSGGLLEISQRAAVESTAVQDLRTCVLPLPVWPYAKHVAIPPEKAHSTNGWAVYLQTNVHQKGTKYLWKYINKH